MIIDEADEHILERPYLFIFNSWIKYGQTESDSASGFRFLAFLEPSNLRKKKLKYHHEKFMVYNMCQEILNNDDNNR